MQQAVRGGTQTCCCNQATNSDEQTVPFMPTGFVKVLAEMRHRCCASHVLHLLMLQVYCIADRITPPFCIASDVERASISQRRRPAPVWDDHFPVCEDR